MPTLSYNAKRKLLIWSVVFAVGVLAVIIGGCFAFTGEVDQEMIQELEGGAEEGSDQGLEQ